MRGLGNLFRLLVLIASIVAIVMRLRGSLEPRPELVEPPESLGEELDRDVGLDR